MLLWELGLAYTRRVQWEARVHAVEIGKVLAELMGGKDGSGSSDTNSKYRRVSGGTLLQQMGVKIGGPIR